MNHLPFNDFDMAGITNTVSKYKSAGLQADYNLERKDEGIVYITFENPVTRDGSGVMFEVHKLSRPGWLRAKPWWVVQLWSKASGEGAVQKRGCVAAKVQAYALSEAETDVQFNFLSVCDFKLAAQGWDNSPRR